MDPLLDPTNMPISAPSYSPAPPFHYRDAQVVQVTYEADPERVVKHLPSGLELLGGEANCTAWFSRFPFSTFGPYSEVVMLVDVTLDGEPYSYVPFAYVDGDGGMTSGRELFGFPKKLAEFSFSYYDERHDFHNQLFFTVDRPVGRRLLTAGMSPEELVAQDELPGHPHLTLRHIPNCEKDKLPSVCELLHCEADFLIHPGPSGEPDVWAGTASLSMDSPSEHDPVHDLAPVRIKRGFSCVMDLTLKDGKVLHNYLSDSNNH